MRMLLLLIGFSAGLLVLGCEAKTKFDPNYKASDEENRKIKAEDKAIEDEESHGSNSKPRAKKK